MTPSHSLRAALLAALALISTAVLAVTPSSAATRRPTPTPTPTPTAPSCGATAIPKAGGGYWTCTFADEFSSTALDRAKWIPQQTATSNFRAGDSGCWVDDPDNIFVSGGTLKLVARKESAPVSCGSFSTPYTAGLISTYGGRFSQTYGRFEARMKVPGTNIPGLQESFWLWPVDPFKYGLWPASGEIDIAEMYSNYNDRAIPFIHYNSAGVDPNVTNNYCLISNLNAFHTYAVEWTPTTIKVIYDGQTCLVDNWSPAAPLVKPAPFDHPFIIALDQSFGVAATNNALTAQTPLPATTEVDYVRVWK